MCLFNSATIGRAFLTDVPDRIRRPYGLVRAAAVGGLHGRCGSAEFVGLVCVWVLVIWIARWRPARRIASQIAGEVSRTASVMWEWWSLSQARWSTPWWRMSASATSGL